MYECISVPSTENHDKCSANSTTGVYKFFPDIITQSSCDMFTHLLCHTGLNCSTTFMPEISSIYSMLFSKTIYS